MSVLEYLKTKQIYNDVSPQKFDKNAQHTTREHATWYSSSLAPGTSTELISTGPSQNKIA
eukprot:2177882-Rhodomonas_salina.1